MIEEEIDGEVLISYLEQVVRAGETEVTVSKQKSSPLLRHFTPY